MQSQQANVYEAVYEYNNAYYSITDTTEVHELLKNDSNYLAEYVAKTTTAPVLVSISENTGSGKGIVLNSIRRKSFKNETTLKNLDVDMAGTKSKKQPGALSKLYLASYNLAQTLGWSYILYQIILYYIEPSSGSTLWGKTKVPVIIFQNAAVLEIMHAATGLVPSNVIITTFQVFSRVMVVVGVILATPYTYAVASPGLPLALIAWSITEIIRYFYYFLNLFSITLHALVWLRYTMFIGLYPLGVTGELLCFYAATKYAFANPDAWSYVLPNKWNFTFSYLYLLIVIMLGYIPGFSHLYLHMFAQRRKILNPSATAKEKH